MAETLIEWADRVWNFIRGCSLISPGCKRCYAMKTAHRFSGPGGTYEGLTEMGPDGPRWNGQVRFVEEKLMEPLHVKTPQRWFVNSMSDLFHEDVPSTAIARAFAIMAATPWHTYQILTKRPERMRDEIPNLREHHRVYLRDLPNEVHRRRLAALAVNARCVWPLPNVWLGVSVESQDYLWRIDMLKDVPAAVRFVSFEPLLEDLGAIMLDRIHWAIVGGESGPGARTFDIAWARSTVEQCKDAGVACFVKQFGANIIHSKWPRCERSFMNFGRVESIKLKSRKGSDMSEWPEDLRVRQFPQVTR